jgi:type IV pilus assembly protein PilE
MNNEISNMNPKTYRQHILIAAGFTLIELMIVVAVIGILAALAYPSYQCYVERSQRGSAVGVLLEGSQFMERFFTTNNGYAVDVNGAAVVLPSSFTVSPRDGAAKYNITLSNVTTTSFRLNAAPVVASACTPQCGTLSIDQQQTRTVTGAGGVDACFQR